MSTRRVLSRAVQSYLKFEAAPPPHAIHDCPSPSPHPARPWWSGFLTDRGHPVESRFQAIGLCLQIVDTLWIFAESRSQAIGLCFRTGTRSFTDRLPHGLVHSRHKATAEPHGNLHKQRSGRIAFRVRLFGACWSQLPEVGRQIRSYRLPVGPTAKSNPAGWVPKRLRPILNLLRQATTNLRRRRRPPPGRHFLI